MSIKNKSKSRKTKSDDNKDLMLNHHWIFAIIILAALAFFINLLIQTAEAVPVGPTVTYGGNTSRITPSNATLNESSGGGKIYTYLFDVVEQNQRWKAYVGNVTGTLTLDDANSYTIFSWDLGVVSGEVYATRNNTAISWNNVNCTWAATSGSNNTNRTIEDLESNAMQHTKLDNITSTFSFKNHTAFQVGSKSIPQDYCYSLFTYVNDTNQYTLDTTTYPELVMVDNNNLNNPYSILYVSLIENNAYGYITGNSYDFQMLVPEVGSSAWTSSTPYYFYVELA